MGTPATVLEALRRFIPELRQTTPAFSPQQHRAIRAITRCRTPALGGRAFGCKQCSHIHFAYHSCNHKACPQCGALSAHRWAKRELRKLVNAPYFLVTFTLPAQLRSCFFGPRAKEAFDLFFAAVSGALSQKLAADKALRAHTNGFVAVLHTWTQRLEFHPHIHCLVPGAGLDEHHQFVTARKPDFLLYLPHLQAAFRQHLYRIIQAARLAGRSGSLAQKLGSAYPTGRFGRQRAQIPQRLCLPHRHHQCPHAAGGFPFGHLPLEGSRQQQQNPADDLAGSRVRAAATCVMCCPRGCARSDTTAFATPPPKPPACASSSTPEEPCNSATLRQARPRKHRSAIARFAPGAASPLNSSSRLGLPTGSEAPRQRPSLSQPFLCRMNSARIQNKNSRSGIPCTPRRVIATFLRPTQHSLASGCTRNAFPASLDREKAVGIDSVQSQSGQTSRKTTPPIKHKRHTG